MIYDEKCIESLFIRENPSFADIAIVFGSSDETEGEQRIKRAIELYKDGFVCKLLLAGGRSIEEKPPESIQMQKIALGYGIPQSSIFIEDRSTNTVENVKFSLEVLQEAKLNKISKVILVSSEWHMKRILWIVKRYFPSSVYFICCPTQEGCNRENWRQSDVWKKMLLNEALLLRVFQKNCLSNHA